MHDRSRRGVVAVALLATQIGCHGRPPATQPSTAPVAFALTLDHLRIDKTTERGADETFALVTVQRNGKLESVTRLPGETDHWDMNDTANNDCGRNTGCDSRWKNQIPLAAGPLKSGDIVTIVVRMMEEDDGSTQSIMPALRRGLEATGDPYAATASSILGIITAMGLKFENTDDFLGSFYVTIRNEAGVLRTNWRPLDRMGPWAANQNTPGFGGPTWGGGLIGDGSRYGVALHLDVTTANGTHSRVAGDQ